MFEEKLLNPTVSNKRHQDPDCVYHVYNRVAHSVRFLKEEEKDDLLDRLRRVAEFCGIRLLSWCMMTNHFHILIYLPQPLSLTREEIERRFALLRSDERAIFYDGFILDRAPQEVTRRMYNVGMFMKIVKENFTLDYNARTGHHGTMWEGPYCFKKVPMTVHDLSTVASYQNLNPVRACMASDYTSYPWTSFAAAANGDELAISGLEFVFGGFQNRMCPLSASSFASPVAPDRTDVSDTLVHPMEAVSDSVDRTDVSNTLVRSHDVTGSPRDRTDVSDTLVRSKKEVVAMMQEKMDSDLEAYRRERAEMVWRRRLAGRTEEKLDPLTSEALVAQVEAQMAKLQSEELRATLEKLFGHEVREDVTKMVRTMAADPGVGEGELATISGASVSRVKRVSLLLQKLGIVRREGTRRRSFWRIDLRRLFEKAN